MNRRQGVLFAQVSLPDEATHRTEESLRFVGRADVNDLLNRGLEVLVEEFVIPFTPVTVRWDDVTMTEPTSERTVTQGTFGAIRRPIARSTLTVPVDGDPLLLTYWSHSGAPMGELPGTVKGQAIEFTWSGALDSSPESISAWFQQVRERIQCYVDYNNGDLGSLNGQMRQRIRMEIERRRQEELSRRNLSASLPFPLVRSPGAQRPVSVHRKQLTVIRSAPAPTFSPEPLLENEIYEDILRDCTAMATVFERTPSIESMKEEEIRNIFLGMLNTNYTGRVAGEVFNGEGKTDICVREEDRNVFIGECKFYRGEKSVINAIDQLLGYLVWRDTKAALLLFVPGGNFTHAVGQAIKAVSCHPQCQSPIPVAEDPMRRSDYVFARSDDVGRSIQLALLPFHLRKVAAVSNLGEWRLS